MHMPDSDLNAAIRSLVADEVAAALDPYGALLERMSGLFGSAPVRRGPGRPRKAVAKEAKPAPVHRRRRRGSKAKAAARAASKLSVGQKVSYNVGRGKFEGKVVRIDVSLGKVVVERLTDGKRALRPAAKVVPA
jgi:hypothetical protein